MEVTIEKLDHYGRGITRINDKICFVDNALPTEIVEIKNLEEKKKYFQAETEKIIKPSINRITPICPFAKECGGCQLLHMDFASENKWKEQKIKEIMKKFANISENKIQNIIAESPYNYRNKITLHQQKNKVGLYKNKTNEIVEITECALIDKKLNSLINNIKTKDETIILRIGNKTDEIAISTDKKKIITSYIGDKKYRVSLQSFFQINSKITEKIYEAIKETLKTKEAQNVLDLYCGTGTIGIYVSDVVKKVLGIESYKEAIEDAKENKKMNQVNNITFKLGKVENLTQEITKIYDTVIIDPPRSGLDKKVVDKLLEIIPKNILYVSCDPITLARDLNLLQKKYEIEYIRPYNMFPRTYHVECVCVLKLR